jgi:hypothetical protein
MGHVVTSFSKNDGLYVFPQNQEFFDLFLYQKVDVTSHSEQVVLNFYIGTKQFRQVINGSFKSIVAGQTFLEFITDNQNALISSQSIYKSGTLWQTENYGSGTKIADVFIQDTYRAYTGDDVFEGSFYAADYVNGYAGNDKMSGFGFTPTENEKIPMALDIFFGGDGLDTAIFPNPRKDYTVSSSNTVYDPVRQKGDLSGYKVRNITKPDFGQADLYQVERIRFSDSSLALDLAGNAGKAYRVYKAAFARDPMSGDEAGLGYWIAQIDRGMDMVEVAARFIDSPEFRGLYGQNSSNADFLTKVYTNVLGRTPDQGGYNWWLNELNNNPTKTKAKVLADFAESGENQAGVASLIGSGIQYTEFVG